MLYNYKIYLPVIILVIFSFSIFASASGGSSANYQIDNDSVSSAITQNSSSASYSVVPNTGNNQITASTTTNTSTSTVTTTQVAASSSVQQGTSGSGGLQASAPIATSSLPLPELLTVVARMFTNVFGPHETPQLSASVAAAMPPPPGRSLFDIRAISIKQTYAIDEQPEVRILFDNFGEQPTRVDFTIEIDDQSGHEVLHYDDSIVVKTTGDYSKKIKRLPEGLYHVVVHTQYAKTVRHIFRFTFAVKKTPEVGARSVVEHIAPVMRSMPWQGWAWLVTAIIALLCAVLIRLRGRR